MQEPRRNPEPAARIRSVARTWKRRTERWLVRCGAPSAARRLHRPSTTILAYHNVVPTGEPAAGEQNLHVDQRAFGEHLDFILEDYDVVSLRECGEPRSSERDRIVITFDDAYLGTMTAGLEELAKRDLPCTVFVPPGLLGHPGFWWDRLAPEGGAALPEGLRTHCLTELQGRQERITAWAKERGLGLQELPAHARPVDEETLVESVSGRLVTLGAHTWSHANLAALTPAEVRDELTRSKSWLQSRVDRYVDWLAYPYGLYTPSVAQEASRTFAGSVLVEGHLAERRGRWLAPRPMTPRIVVPRDIALPRLALKIAGIRF